MSLHPKGGMYRDEGVAEFMKRFDFDDQPGKTDSINFGGRDDCLRGPHGLTGL